MMKTNAKNETTARTGTTDDAIALLKADHQAVEKLFAAFEKTGNSLDAKHTLVRRACEELTVHAMLEEEIFYPASVKLLEADGEPDVNEAYVEHFLVKSLIEKFASMKPADDGFDATFKVMTELVRHHIQEEETELFPKVKEAGADLKKLGARLAERKAQLEAKLPKDAGDHTLARTA
jgi:hemerythrin superfamily protein